MGVKDLSWLWFSSFHAFASVAKYYIESPVPHDQERALKVHERVSLERQILRKRIVTKTYHIPIKYLELPCKCDFVHRLIIVSASLLKQTLPLP